MNEKLWRAKIAGILKEKMRENGFSQYDLAKRLGVTQEAVSLWVREKSTISGWNLAKICVVFDLDIYDIVPPYMFDWQYAEGKKA